MALADRTFRQVVFNPLEVQCKTGIIRSKNLIHLATHSFNLCIGFLGYVRQLRSKRLCQQERVGESFAAQVGATGVSGIIHTQTGFLVGFVQTDKFYIEQRIQSALLAACRPCVVAGSAVKIIYSHHFYAFGNGSIERFSNILECTE